MAQEDPDQLFAAFRILERRAHQLLAPHDAQLMITPLQSLTAELELPEPNWDLILFFAKRATNRISVASSLLPSAESNLLEMGLTLKRLSNRLEKLDKTTRLQVKKRLKALLSGRERAISQAFKTASANKLGYLWVVKIYNFLDRELRY